VCISKWVVSFGGMYTIVSVLIPSLQTWNSVSFVQLYLHQDPNVSILQCSVSCRRLLGSWLDSYLVLVKFLVRSMIRFTIRLKIRFMVLQQLRSRGKIISPFWNNIRWGHNQSGTLMSKSFGIRLTIPNHSDCHKCLPKAHHASIQPPG